MKKDLLQKIASEFWMKNSDVEGELIYRNGRRCVEWVCKHGIGHPIWDSQGFYGHGCDGCCADLNWEYDAEEIFKE